MSDWQEKLPDSPSDDQVHPEWFKENNNEDSHEIQYPTRCRIVDVTGEEVFPGMVIKPLVIKVDKERFEEQLKGAPC